LRITAAWTTVLYEQVRRPAVMRDLTVTPRNPLSMVMGAAILAKSLSITMV